MSRVNSALLTNCACAFLHWDASGERVTYVDRNAGGERVADEHFGARAADAAADGAAAAAAAAAAEFAGCGHDGAAAAAAAAADASSSRKQRRIHTSERSSSSSRPICAPTNLNRDYDLNYNHGGKTRSQLGTRRKKAAANFAARSASTRHENTRRDR